MSYIMINLFKEKTIYIYIYKMPKIPTDYSKTIFYKIVCKDLDIKDSYVGHTTNFTKRKSCHKSDCNNQNKKNYNFNVYKFIRQYGGWENWEMIEIKKYACNDKREAEVEERKIYEELNSTLNSYRPFTTDDEKREKTKKHSKNYYENNKEEILEKNKNKNKNVVIVKEVKSKYNNTYYNKKKDKLLDDMKQKVKCECCASVCKVNLLRHLKTKKHQKYINNL